MFVPAPPMMLCRFLFRKNFGGVAKLWETHPAPPIPLLIGHSVFITTPKFRVCYLKTVFLLFFFSSSK